MKTWAKDLHRKGELNKIEAMENYASEIIRGKDIGTAFITEGFYGYDGLALIPNRPAFSNYEGYIVFDEADQQPKFIRDEEE
jgi:hypothetical protein